MSGSVKSSFQKKGKAKVVSIPGTRPSIHNAQLLLSVGVPSLDYLLGGGIPVGSLIIIKEDKYDVYSKLFLKYFLAEGVMNKHMLTVASLDSSPELITGELPAATNADPENNISVTEEQMTIAWRYQQMKTQTSSPNSSNNCFGHNYDLTKIMDSSCLSGVDIHYWNGISDDTQGKGVLENKNYWSLYQDIKMRIQQSDLSTSSNKAKTNVMRIGLHSLGSPLWGWEFGCSEKKQQWKSLTTFLYILRALVRSSYSVCMITVPSHIFSDPALMLRLQNLSDFVVGLESFQGSEKETNPIFKDYHGLFHVAKLSAINSLVPPILDTVDWVFKLKRRKLVIERLHLPPELSETANRNQEDPVKATGQSMCSGGKLPKNLDF
ncbi:unnamed protein product [Meganyctiphanes norvegica]|uniref:Elongator complex protein 4 n=1 Tax=Meganyctiphanes norvegica TaxID=48144 RepID=A0AAV2SHW3_MEGNR